jgi:hypothetical protein
MKKFVAASIMLVSMSLGTAANAAAIYNNLNTSVLNGDCSFSTTCAANAGGGRGNEFAAQGFSLGALTTVTFGSFSELTVGGITPTSVNFAIYAASGGLPSGAALFSGSSALTDTSLSPVGGFNVDLESFGIGNDLLGPGNYFFAIQAVSANFGDYLQQGLVQSGAAESNDGGATWASGYENLAGGSQLGGISVALYNSNPVKVPEPLTLSLFGVGFAGLAATRRRKKAAQA